MPRSRNRSLARLAWISGALALLATAPPAPAMAAPGDCFGITRHVAALRSTIQALRASLAKAAPEAKVGIEKEIAETEAKVANWSPDLDECWYTLRVHAVRVSDSCPGQRAAEIDPDQVRRWIDKANEVYRVARVRFEFDLIPKSGDWASLNSTEVNDLTGELPGDAVWERGNSIGNELASHYPGKVLLLFRHGPGAGATGGGFSGTRYNYVVLPGFPITTACGGQNAFLMAHELGHYFGLNHTFREFKTRTAAAEAFRAAGSKPSAFDGDGLADTPPEPYIEELACGRDTTVRLNGVPFSLQRNNVMSYYFNDTKTLIPEQVRVVRSWVERRFADAMDGTGPFVPDERRTYTIVSTENGRSLEVAGASKERGAKIVQANWSGGANQTWRIVPLTAQDTGSFEIVSVATGKCLTVGTTEAVALVQWDWEGRKDQKWRFLQDAGGDLVIESKRNQRVLAVPGTTRATGVNLELPGTGAVPRQRWRLVPQD